MQNFGMEKITLIDVHYTIIENWILVRFNWFTLFQTVQAACMVIWLYTQFSNNDVSHVKVLHFVEFQASCLNPEDGTHSKS
jgi:hypothetical protein